MIYPKIDTSVEKIAAHYNTFYGIYRELWGEHLHHGFWQTGRETVEEATVNLLHEVVKRGQITSGMSICDVGSGYGATARWLAEHCQAKVTGLTISEKQYRFSVAQGGARFILRDFLENTLPANAFDRVLSIESSEHMIDKEKFFQEANRLLKPGGKLLICAWLSSEDPSQWQIDHLLEPICSEGHLPSLGSMEDYRRLAEDAGFSRIDAVDISQNVQKTWVISIYRAMKHFLCNSAFRREFFHAEARDRRFLLTLFRLRAAFFLKCFRYAIMTAEKR